MNNNIKVLIVEDEPPISMEISFILEDYGYQVAASVYSSEDAIEYLSQNTVDIALLDINIMGSMNGIELAHHINKFYQIPFLYISSFSDGSTMEKANATKPKGFIGKPFKSEDINNAIELALSNKDS